MRSPRAVVVLMLAGLAIAACGARLPDKVSQQAQAAALNQGSSAGGAPIGGTSTTGPGSGAPGPVSSTGPNPGSTTGTTVNPVGGSTSGPQGQSTNPTTGKTTGSGTQTADCSSASISGTGVDASSITVGTISDVTGPVSGLFQGAQQGIEAFAQYVNATQGGICGHQLKVAFQDGGTNCTQTQNAAQSLASRVFAFVGSFALYDNCAATIVKQHPNLPDIHVALDPAAGPPANHFDLEPGALGYATGPFAALAKKYGSKVQHVGTIAEALPSALEKQAAITGAAKAAGWKFVYSVNEQPTTSNFTNDFVKMCQQAHIQIFFTVTEDAQNAATMIQNENQAGCKGVINVIPIAYDPAFVSAFGGNTSAINGLQGYNEYSLFFNPGEAQHIPALQQLQSWFARTYPGQPLNLYAMFAWCDGVMFQQALEHAGKKITQQTVLAALHKIKNFTADGITAPSNPSSKTTGNTCYILWQFQNGSFSRQSPASGFRCDGRFVAK